MTKIAPPLVDKPAKPVVNSNPRIKAKPVRNLSITDRIPLPVSLVLIAVRGRDNHQRARCNVATGVDQSRKRGCESLERDQGRRQPADSLDNVNDCRNVHGLSATAWLRRE